MRTLLGCVMISNAALFFFGAIQHSGTAIGRFHEPRIIPAAIVETICGLFLAWGTIAVFGQSILSYLGVELPSLQAAGGLLLLLVALQLLTGSYAEPTEEERLKVNVAFVPLGTPLLAGPGAIVATMVFVQRASTAAQFAAFSVALAAVTVLLWLTMRFSGVIHRILRPSGVELLTRIAGLLLSAIAVQLIVDAIRSFITGG